MKCWVFANFYCIYSNSKGKPEMLRRVGFYQRLSIYIDKKCDKIIAQLAWRNFSLTGRVNCRIWLQYKNQFWIYFKCTATKFHFDPFRNVLSIQTHTLQTTWCPKKMKYETDIYFLKSWQYLCSLEIGIRYNFLQLLGHLVNNR